MHVNPTYYLFFWLIRLSGPMVLLSVPNEFWTQVIAVFEVPDVVRIAVAPLFGSFAATAVEYLTVTETDHKKWHWPLKLAVGYLAGAYGGGSADIIFKGSPETLAFWGGVLGYGSITLALMAQKKKMNENEKGDTNG